jgi:hypothetical protein
MEVFRQRSLRANSAAATVNVVAIQALRAIFSLRRVVSAERRVSRELADVSIERLGFRIGCDQK